MEDKFNIKRMAEHRWFYEFKKKNRKNERIVVEVTYCFPDITDKSLPVLWKRNGYTKNILENYISIDVYCYEENGNCYGRYNPQIKLSEDKKRNVINFDWLLTVNEKNLNKILGEVERLAFAK